MRTWLVGMALALCLLVTGTARADSYIQANCQVVNAGSQCVFTNTGADAGSACAVIHLAHRTSGQATDSTLLCSGVLQPGGTVTLPALFGGSQPAAVCLTGVVPSWNDCTLEVRMSNATAVSSGAGAFSLLIWLFVIASSVWVYVDAKRIGARKGLIPGFGDFNPGGWLICSLFIWIIGFPLYLSKRAAIKVAALNAQAYGQAPPGYGPPGYGGPPPGYEAPPGQGGQPPWQG